MNLVLLLPSPFFSCCCCFCRRIPWLLLLNGCFLAAETAAPQSVTSIRHRQPIKYTDDRCRGVACWSLVVCKTVVDSVLLLLLIHPSCSRFGTQNIYEVRHLYPPDMRHSGKTSRRRPCRSNTSLTLNVNRFTAVQ